METKAGQTRGFHYHKETIELFFIIEGKIEVSIRTPEGELKKQFIAEKGDIFLIEPFEIHTFHTRVDSKWLNFLSKRIDDQNPDFHIPKETYQ